MNSGHIVHGDTLIPLILIIGNIFIFFAFILIKILEIATIAEVGNTEIVLCKSQSRFSRSMEMIEKYLHKEFPAWNVRFVGLVDNADTSVKENKKARQINGLVNEWFVEDTSKSTREMLESMKRNGQFTGSYAPYGYLIDPKDKHHLISDSYTRKAIKIMTGMLKHGKGMELVVEVLMRKKFLTPADYKESIGMKVKPREMKSIMYQVEENETLKSIAYKYYITTEEIKHLNNMKTNQVKQGDILIIPLKQKWNSTMIRDIVTNEMQIGTLVQGKTRRRSYKDSTPIPISKEDWIRVPHCHEANIDLETYNIMCKMFQKRTKNRVEKNGEIPLFSKKVYCECCNQAFYKNSANYKNENNQYLQCSVARKAGENLCDNGESIKLVEFKKDILEKINEKINEYFNLSKVNKEYYRQDVYSNIDNDIKRLEIEKDKIKKEIEVKNQILVQLYQDKVMGNLSNEEFIAIKSTNAVEIGRLKERLFEIDREISNISNNKEKQLNREKLFEKYKNVTELNRVVLGEFIKKIIVGKRDIKTGKRQIKIKWNLYTTQYNDFEY